MFQWSSRTRSSKGDSGCRDDRKSRFDARALSFAFSARHISDLARFNRVEGLALGSGFLQRLGGGVAVAASARYGFSDKELKGRGALEYTTGAGSRLTLGAERQYRDVGD